MYRKPGWKKRLFERSLFLHKFIAKRFKKFIRVDDVGLKSYEPRRATLELMSREIYHYGIEGNAAELGVYRGDFAKHINHYFPDRKLYLFDTFEGFDCRDADFDRQAGNWIVEADNFSKTSVELVLSKMEHKENCIIRKGWFPETADGIDDKFCFVSIDADLYQPTIAGLEFFYPRLVHSGVIMIHDFCNEQFSGVRKAVREFCDRNNIGYVCLSDARGSAVITR